MSPEILLLQNNDSIINIFYFLTGGASTPSPWLHHWL